MSDKPISEKAWNEHVHSSITERIQINAESWSTGSGKAIVAHTKSGSMYRVESNGHVVQIKGNRGHPTGELNGAVYRANGPIRVAQVVVGLSIEYIPPDREHYCYTSVVTEIIFEDGESPKEPQL